MRTICKPLAVALLLLAGAAPGADDAHLLKRKAFPEAGKGVVIQQTKTQSGTVKVFDADGKLAREQKTDVLDEELFTRTVVDKGDGRPKKFKQVFDRATYKNGDVSVPKPHQGYTLIYTLKDGKYEAGTDSETDLSAEYLAALGQRVNTPALEELVLPRKAVKAGESWAIDLKELARTFGEDTRLNEAKSKGEARLVKVYDKDGKKFGVIEVKMALALTRLGKAMADPPLAADFRGTLDLVIDGTGTAAKVSLAGTIKGKLKTDTGMTVEMDSALTSEEEYSAEK